VELMGQGPPPWAWVDPTPWGMVGPISRRFSAGTKGPPPFGKGRFHSWRKIKKASDEGGESHYGEQQPAKPWHPGVSENGKKPAKAGRRGERTPLDLEAKAKFLLAHGYSLSRTAKEVGLPRSTVLGISARFPPEQRKEWSQEYRSWVVDELLPQAKGHLLASLPAAKAWELNNILGTHIDKLLVLEGRPTDIHAHLHAHRHEILDVGERLAQALEIKRRALGMGGANTGGDQDVT